MRGHEKRACGLYAGRNSIVVYKLSHRFSQENRMVMVGKGSIGLSLLIEDNGWIEEKTRSFGQDIDMAISI